MRFSLLRIAVRKRTSIRPSLSFAQRNRPAPTKTIVQYTKIERIRRRESRDPSLRQRLRFGTLLARRVVAPAVAACLAVEQLGGHCAGVACA